MKRSPQAQAVKGVADPLTAFHGKPLVGVASQEHRYMGRIVIEVYESDQYASVADSLAFTVDLAEGVGIDHQELMVRVAQGFPERIARLPR
ncbi:MAG TPA: hypothetical protein VKY19_23425 [Ktedonosporobacter sp.]|jgi:hypothetical protein|nr:hypothetical protein [Ktedonosporobacter sp.]